MSELTGTVAVYDLKHEVTYEFDNGKLESVSVSCPDK